MGSRKLFFGCFVFAIFFLIRFEHCFAQTGIISTVAGNGICGSIGDGGQATAAELWYPMGIACDISGNIYIADEANNKIRKVTASGIITTIAGTGAFGYGGDDSDATLAKLSNPTGVAVDSNGNVYIADPGNNRIRKINSAGIISTFAGIGIAGFTGDGGDATAAQLHRCTHVAVDRTGCVYIADTYNNLIRKVNTSGIISTYAGNLIAGYSGDLGAATNATLFSPEGMAFDMAGNCYIADALNDRIRKVDILGNISTVVGNGTGGFSGDGGQATNAQIYPYDISVDSTGNLYIVDVWNHRIRKVNNAGIIATIAGTGIAGYNGDGISATTAQLDTPAGVAVNRAGFVYIADVSNQRIRKISNPVELNNLYIQSSPLKIYPNPNNGYFFIKYKSVNSKSAFLRITDVIGETKFQYFIDANKENELKLNLAKGVYFLSVLNENEIYVDKILVMD